MANFRAMLLRLLFWLLSLPWMAYAQSTQTTLGARAAGMGYAFAPAHDEWSFFGNAAGLASLKNKTVATAFESRALPGANRMGLVGIMPLKTGVTGLGIFKFGDALYSEQSIQAAYAHAIGKTSFGVRSGYWQYRAEGFGTRGLLAVSLGGITNLTRHISIAAWIQNINMPKLRFSEKQVAPIKLTAAISFKPSDNFLLISEIEKDVLYNALWKTGIEYRIHKKVFARTGFNINPGSAFFGVGFQTWRIKIDYALQSFSPLGLTHQASASYRLTQLDKQVP
jgi:hypothetical protein